MLRIHSLLVLFFLLLLSCLTSRSLSTNENRTSTKTISSFNDLNESMTGNNDNNNNDYDLNTTTATTTSSSTWTTSVTSSDTATTTAELTKTKSISISEVPITPPEPSIWISIRHAISLTNNLLTLFLGEGFVASLFIKNILLTRAVNCKANYISSSSSLNQNLNKQDLEIVEISMHPFHFSLGSDFTRYWRGTLVFSGLVFYIALLILVFFARVRVLKADKDKSASYEQALIEDLRAPVILSTIHCLFSPIAFVSFVILCKEGDKSSIVWEIIFVLPYLISTMVQIYACYLAHRDNNGGGIVFDEASSSDDSSSDEEENSNTSGRKRSLTQVERDRTFIKEQESNFRKMLFRLYYSYCHFFDKRRWSLRYQRSENFRRFGAFFSFSSSPRYEIFQTVVLILFCILVALMESTNNNNNNSNDSDKTDTFTFCQGLSGCSAVLMFLSFMYWLWRYPLHLHRKEMISFGIIQFLNLVLASLIFAKFSKKVNLFEKAVAKALETNRETTRDGVSFHEAISIHLIHLEENDLSYFVLETLIRWFSFAAAIFTLLLLLFYGTLLFNKMLTLYQRKKLKLARNHATHLLSDYNSSNGSDGFFFFNNNNNHYNNHSGSNNNMISLEQLLHDIHSVNTQVSSKLLQEQQLDQQLEQKQDRLEKNRIKQQLYSQQDFVAKYLHPGFDFDRLYDVSTSQQQFGLNTLRGMKITDPDQQKIIRIVQKKDPLSLWRLPELFSNHPDPQKLLELMKDRYGIGQQQQGEGDYENDFDFSENDDSEFKMLLERGRAAKREKLLNNNNNASAASMNKKKKKKKNKKKRSMYDENDEEEKRKLTPEASALCITRITKILNQFDRDRLKIDLPELLRRMRGKEDVLLKEMRQIYGLFDLYSEDEYHIIGDDGQIIEGDSDSDADSEEQDGNIFFQSNNNDNSGNNSSRSKYKNNNAKTNRRIALELIQEHEPQLLNHNDVDDDDFGDDNRPERNVVQEFFERFCGREDILVEVLTRRYERFNKEKEKMKQREQELYYSSSSTSNHNAHATTLPTMMDNNFFDDDDQEELQEKKKKFRKQEEKEVSQTKPKFQNWIFDENSRFKDETLNLRQQQQTESENASLALFNYYVNNNNHHNNHIVSALLRSSDSSTQKENTTTTINDFHQVEMDSFGSSSATDEGEDLENIVSQQQQQEENFEEEEDLNEALFRGGRFKFL